MRKSNSSIMTAMAFLALVGALLACGSSTNTVGPLTSPTTIVNVVPNRPHRNFMTIQYCVESMTSFNRSYVQKADQLMAQNILSAIRENQDGFTVYINAINTQTYNETAETSMQPILVPAIGTYLGGLTPPPTPDDSNPIFTNSNATAYTKTVNSTQTPYALSDATILQQINQATANVQASTQALAQWNPPIDSGMQSVMGCLQLAQTRFQYQTGIKLLYIASDLENTSNFDYTDRFFLAKGLSGATVHVLFLASNSAPQDHYKRTLWCPYLENAGAIGVLFSDPNTSIGLFNTPDLFTKDGAFQGPCPTE